MNEIKKLRLAGYIGLLGSLMMFLGDMLLYFTTEPFGNIEDEILPSMGSVPLARMFAGGLLGPLAACLFLIGFYHIYLTIKEPQKIMAKLMLICLCCAYVIGGAYHAFFPAYGIVAAQGHPELIAPLTNYAEWLGLTLFLLFFLGWLIFCYLVLRRRTIYPRWVVLATPIVSFWFAFLWEYLPQPLLIVIGGGWNSLVSTLFFTVSLIILRSKKPKYSSHRVRYTP